MNPWKAQTRNLIIRAHLPMLFFASALIFYISGQMGEGSDSGWAWMLFFIVAGAVTTSGDDSEPSVPRKVVAALFQVATVVGLVTLATFTIAEGYWLVVPGLVVVTLVTVWVSVQCWRAGGDMKTTVSTLPGGAVVTVTAPSDAAVTIEPED